MFDECKYLPKRKTAFDADWWTWEAVSHPCGFWRGTEAGLNLTIVLIIATVFLFFGGIIMLAEWAERRERRRGTCPHCGRSDDPEPEQATLPPTHSTT